MTEERKRKMSIDEIEAIALELPGEQLDELIDRLDAHRGMSADLEHEWLEEVQRRVPSTTRVRWKESRWRRRSRSCARCSGEGHQPSGSRPGVREGGCPHA